MSASGSWTVCVDNVSTIGGWLSDALCKASTGDGMVRRARYTDSDLAVLAFRRVVALTSVDPGALRGDLGDRLLVIHLERIEGKSRRTEAELNAAYAAALPLVLGGLLSAVARTLAALPGVELAELPRMADFARVAAALDAACPELTGKSASPDTGALARFMGQRRRIADDVVESDPVALAVVKLMDGRPGPWAGKASDLLAAITPPGATPPRGWPGTAKKLSGLLQRLRPALAEVGIEHVPPAPTDKSRTHTLTRVEPPDPGGSGRLPDTDPPNRPTNRPAENGLPDRAAAALGGPGGSGGCPGDFSEGAGPAGRGCHAGLVRSDVGRTTAPPDRPTGHRRRPVSSPSRFTPQRGRPTGPRPGSPPGWPGGAWARRPPARPGRGRLGAGRPGSAAASHAARIARGCA